MEVWKEYTINDICKTIFAGGDAVKYNPTKNKTEENNIPIYANSVENEGLYGYCSKPLVTEPAVTVAARGAGTGFVCYRKYPYVPIVRLLTLIPNENVDAHFLYYRLKKNFIKGDGSAIPQLTVPMIKKERITLPSLPTQQKIANILSSLDDKIEVNRRIIEQLEELAQALFKSWFVDFEPFKDGEFVESELGMIPEGWKVGTLGNVADVVMGASPAGSSYNTEGNGSIFYQGRTDFGFRFPNVRMYTTEPKRFAESNSVLLSVRAPVGDVNIAFEECCIGRGLASIKSNSNADSYTYYLMKSLKPVLDNYNNEGTVFGCINKDALNNLSIVVPTIEIIKEFERIVSCSDMEIRRRSEEITHLTNLRDTLLPKLMSGEIDVNEVEI